MKFKRILQLEDLLQKKSHFLFGPRGTGKSYLIRNSNLPRSLSINLLKSEDYLDLSLNPENLRLRIDPKKHKIVIIDEVQKIPQLLNEVHYMIEEHGTVFLLTGSSTRKLKSGQANMLGGRARTAQLFPLCFAEIEKFDIQTYLRFGGLPSVLNSDEKKEDLSAYVMNYINDEIKAEGTIRKLDFFQRFLNLAALCSAEVVNYANISRDVGVSEPTVKSYFQILEDTMIGFQLFPWRKGSKRKSIVSNKFYFFDTGVMHTILRSPEVLDRNSDTFGKTFEQFIAQEIRAYLAYKRKDYEFCFWRSLDQTEVDFVINNETAVEVKASKKMKIEHLKGLKIIADEGLFRSRLLVTFDPIEKEIEGIKCLPWDRFLKNLWNDEIIS